MSDGIPPYPTTPPPPPPPPPAAAPQPRYAPAYPQPAAPAQEYSGPVPSFQQTGPIPSYPAGPPAQLAVDNTGVPTSPFGPAKQVGTTFLKSLFDVSFHTFITRKAASVIYVIGLVVIGLGAIVTLFGGLAASFAAMGSSYTSMVGVMLLFASLIGVPLGALVLVIMLRLGVEAGVALVAVAENTEQTALNTDSKKA